MVLSNPWHPGLCTFEEESAGYFPTVGRRWLERYFRFIYCFSNLYLSPDTQADLVRPGLLDTGGFLWMRIALLGLLVLGPWTRLQYAATPDCSQEGAGLASQSTKEEDLGENHSARLLGWISIVEQALRKLQGTMSSWRCTCNQTNKASAIFCPGCGKHWQHSARADTRAPQGRQYGQGNPQWETGWQTRPKSPRWRRPKSPRQRDTAGGKAEGKGKLKGPKEPAAPSAPNVAQLPKPPKPRKVPVPKEEPGSAAPAPSEEKRTLDALVAQLAQQEDLPDNLRKMVSQITQGSVKTESKALHRLVAQRQEAITALERIRSERAGFEAGWATYTQSLLDLLSVQFEERTKTLAELDEAQTAWTNRLTESTSALKAATLAAPVVDLEEEIDEDVDAAVDQAAQDSAHQEARQQKMAQQHQQLTQLLVSVKESAEGSAERREGSRTPRRRAKEEIIQELDKANRHAETKKAAEGGESKQAAEAKPATKAPSQHF